MYQKGKGIVAVLVFPGSIGAAIIGYLILNRKIMTMIREPETWQEDWCNFTPDEFRCSCCNRLEISSDIMDLLQKARNELGPLQQHQLIDVQIITKVSFNWSIWTSYNWLCCRYSCF